MRLEARARQWRSAGAMLGAAAVLAAGLMAGLVTTAWGSSTTTTVFLVSNRGSDIDQSACKARHGCGPEVRAPSVLVAGRQYTVVVTGTISVWSFWIRNPCGRPEPRPEYPTPGNVTPTSDDAQFRFAIHLRGAGGRCRKLPFKMGLFQINLGHGWFHPIALGPLDHPSGDIDGQQHPYTFRVLGEGAKPAFRFVDNHPSDNNGAFKIVISDEP